MRKLGHFFLGFIMLLSRGALYGATPPKAAEAPLRCPTVRSLQLALELARTTPNTVIELVPGEYRISRALVVQGDGTTIHGNGATLITAATHTGIDEPLTGMDDQGTALSLAPLLGRDVPFDKNQTNGLWRNPSKTCMALNKAAGGTEQNMFQAAPNQDADGKPTAVYALFAPYRVPARNISIDNVKIRFASQHCDSAVCIAYAKNVLISHVTVLNLPRDLGGENHGDMWSNGAQEVTFDSCSGPDYIEMNSSTNCTVSNSRMGGVTFEEMCRWCTVKDCVLSTCRTNDLLCSDITYDHNTFTATGENVGCIWGGTRVRFTNNICRGAVWLGGSDTRRCVVSGNTGTVFINYAPASSGNILEANTIKK